MTFQTGSKVISIILLLFHNLIPKCQQNLGIKNGHDAARQLISFRLNNISPYTKPGRRGSTEWTTKAIAES